MCVRVFHWKLTGPQRCTCLGDHVADPISKYVLITSDRFEYLYDEGNKDKVTAMANKNVAQNPSGLKRYRINRAYHKYLEIKPSSLAADQAMLI